MEDITSKLIKDIKESFKRDFDQSEIIKDLYRKIRDGTATYADAHEAAYEIGTILSKAFKRNLSSSVLPDGHMTFETAKKIIDPSMINNYEIIAELVSNVQSVLNKRAKIGIKAIKPKLNRDRVEGIIQRVAKESVFDKISWILDEPIKNFSQSIVDDAIKENAEFHGEAGMRPIIRRTVEGNCCEWCRQRAGVYNYPNVPKEIYQRHQRCRCIVDYYPGDGKVQNVHTRKFRDETDFEKRKNTGIISENEKEATKFKRTFAAVEKDKVVSAMRKDSQKWIRSLSEEEVRCIQKYTLNEVREEPKFYERLNAMLRGETKEDETLRYYADTISDALKKSILGENVICYRGTDVNPVEGIPVGGYVKSKQFISTTVVSSRSFDKRYKIVIYAKKGTKRCAYIENISKIPKQREMLFDKDCVYRVLSNSNNLIELEVI